MSYILDALRRADAERDLGAVPSIHTQRVALAMADEAYANAPTRPWRWAVVVALLLLSLVAWLLMSGSESVQQPTAVVTRQAEAPPVAEVPPLDPTPVVQTASSPAPRKVALPTPTPTPTPTPPPPPPPTLATPSRALPKPPAAAARVATAKPILAFSELPDAIRKAQPTLSVGGAMYSADAASRMLILNGQVLHEGDAVTADLILEKINLKSAVLVYKEYRYSINY